MQEKQKVISEKACIIVSPTADVKLLSSVLLDSIQSDVTYFVYQCGITEGDREAFARDYETIVGEEMSWVVQTQNVKPGQVYFLLDALDYDFQKGMLHTSELPTPLEHPVDHLFRNLSLSSYLCSIVLLSGKWASGDVVEGLQTLREKHTHVLAVHLQCTTTLQQVEELGDLGLIDGYYPPHVVLSHVNFSDSMPVVDFKRHWLIVDSEIGLREVVRDILYLEGMTCDFASDEKQAAEKISKNKYSALLLDIKDVKQGIGILNTLSEANAQVPILVIGEDQNPMNFLMVQFSQVVGVLQKPFTAQEIRRYFPLFEISLKSEELERDN